MIDLRLLGAATALAVLFSTSALAADVAPLLQQPQPVEAQDDWSFAASPYFWGASLSGKTKQFGLPTVKIDADFGDILSNLDFAAMAAAEFRYQRFSVIGDFMYSKLGATGHTPFGVLTDSVSVTSETFSGLIGVGYAVVDDPAGHLDVVAGARVWSVSTDIQLNGGPLAGVGGDDSATWVDAVAGLRGKYFLTPEWYLSAWGFVGAGGADIDWDVAAGVGYQFNDTISAIAGYRAMGVDYRQDGFVFDTVQQGPILGLTVRF
jgi:hypothetical protein